jgi:hypothetical protein
MLFWIYQLIAGGIALLVAVSIWKERSFLRQVTSGMVLALLLLRLLLIK